MPFTPFHLGPGLLAKAVLPRRLSLTAFAVTQVAIDLETLYHLARNEWPAHRGLHTVAGASFVGVLVATGLILGRPALARMSAGLLGASSGDRSEIVAETSNAGALLGGLVGGVSHSLLDAMMHADVRPFWPLTNDNPLLRAVSLGSLHTGCVLAGALGLAWWWIAGMRRRSAT